MVRSDPVYIAYSTVSVELYLYIRTTVVSGIYPLRIAVQGTVDLSSQNYTRYWYCTPGKAREIRAWTRTTGDETPL